MIVYLSHFITIFLTGVFLLYAPLQLLAFDEKCLAPASFKQSDQLEMDFRIKNWIEYVNPRFAQTIINDASSDLNPILINAPEEKFIGLFNREYTLSNGILFRDKLSNAGYIVHSISDNPELLYVVTDNPKDIQTILTQDIEITIPAINKFNGTALCLIHRMTDSKGGIRKANLQDEIHLLNEAIKLPLIQNISDSNIKKEIINYIYLGIKTFEDWGRSAQGDEKIPYSEDILSMIWDKSKHVYASEDFSDSIAQIENIYKTLLSTLHQRGDRQSLTDLTSFSPDIAELYFSARLGDSMERIERAYFIIDKNYKNSLEITHKLKMQRLKELLDFILSYPSIPSHQLFILDNPLESLEKNLNLVQKEIKLLQKDLQIFIPYNIPLEIINEIIRLNESKETLEALQQINTGLKGMISKTMQNMNGMVNIDFCIDYSIIDKYYSITASNLLNALPILQEELKKSDADSSQIAIAIEAIKKLYEMEISLKSTPQFYQKKRMFDLAMKAVSCIKKDKDLNPTLNMLTTFLDIYALGEEYRNTLSREYLVRENGKASQDDVTNEIKLLEQLLQTPLQLNEFDSKTLSARERFDEIDLSLNQHLNLIIQGNMTSQKAYRAKRTLTLFFQMASLLFPEENNDGRKNYLKAIQDALIELTPDTEKQIASQITQKLRDNPHETPLNILVMVDNMTAAIENDLMTKFEDQYMGSISGRDTAQGGHFIQVATRKNHSFDFKGQLLKNLKPNDVVIAIFEYGKTRFILNPSQEKVQEMFAKDAERQFQLSQLDKMQKLPIIIEGNNDFKFNFNIGKPQQNMSPIDYLKKYIFPVIEKAKLKGLLSYGLVRSEILFETISVLKDVIFNKFSDFQKTTPYKDFLSMQIEAYKMLLESVPNGEKVTIRTFDLAQDKSMLGLNASEIYAQMDPRILNRASLPEGIDFCLTDEGLPLFQDQLKCMFQAVYKSSSYSGTLHVMFPKITGINQLNKTLSVYHEAKLDFLNQFSENPTVYEMVSKKLFSINLGIMLETNEAKNNPNQFKSIHTDENISFYSIGSNDLNCDIMSLFIKQKVNRIENNPYASYASGIHLPTVRAIIEILKSQSKQPTPFTVGLCGELGGDVYFIALMAALNKLKDNLPEDSPFYLPSDIWQYFVPSLDPGWDPERGIDKINEVRYYFQMFGSLAKNSKEENELLSELLQIINEFSTFGDSLHDPISFPKIYKRDIETYDELTSELYKVLAKVIDYWNDNLPNFLKQFNDRTHNLSYQELLDLAA